MVEVKVPQKVIDECWLVYGLLLLIALNCEWWWFTILLVWTLLFTAVPHALNRTIGEPKNEML
tara:strand:- start:11 stop:199 length:189 start_codon:yes stop_codon:yes gene_type:complete